MNKDDVDTMKTIIKGPNPFKIVRHSSGKMQYEIYGKNNNENITTNFKDPADF